MSDQLQAVLLGAAISAGVALVLAVVGIWAESRRAARRMEHEGRLAAEQRRHEKVEKRYDDLRSAYMAFAAEMRKQVAQGFRYEQRTGVGYVEDPMYDPAENTGYRDAAEDALQALRLFADDALYGAGRSYLDSYYVRFWQYNQLEGVSPDVESAEATFVAEGKRSMGQGDSGRCEHA